MSSGRMAHSQESLHLLFQSKSLEFSRYGSDNDLKKKTSVDIHIIKIDTGNVSSIRTRNSTREIIIYKNFMLKSNIQTFSQLCASSGFLK